MSKNSGQKTVSVVLCTYNGAKYLREQLDSIVNQSLLPDELIIQDDGSTDDTVAIVREYAEKYDFIKFFTNEAMHGVNYNFFSAMQRAKGDFIAISDQDDIWEDRKLEWQMEAIGNHLLCSGVSEPFPSEGCDLRLPNYSLLRLIYVGSSLPGHTLLFPRRLLELIPDVSAPPTVRMYDVIIAFVASSYDKVVYLDKTLVHHRVHDQSATYTAPQNYRKSPLNLFRHAVNDLKLAIELRPKVKDFQTRFLHYILKIKSSEKQYQEAVTMLRLQTSSSFLDFVRLQFFCVRHCDQLFYAKEKKTLFTRLRGWFFPISCYEYYRHFLNRKE